MGFAARPLFLGAVGLYHVSVHSLAQHLLLEIRRTELLNAGERVGIAVSGGIDSVTLLRLMMELRDELGIVLSVVHFNHKLRGMESEEDERFVASLAREFGLEFFCDGGDAAAFAAAEKSSIEAAARELRYGFFRELLGESDPRGLKPNSPLSSHGTTEVVPFPVSVGLDKIATGHTLDDQAETVLMRVIRGAGSRGIAAIHPRLVVEHEDGEAYGEIVRPLLGMRRTELESYLRELGQLWREDSSNGDMSFTRNRVRKQLLPLLREFNPAIEETLAEQAELAREEEDYWENEVAGWMGTAVHWAEPEWAQMPSASGGLIQISDGHPGTEDRNPHPPATNGVRVGRPEQELQARIDSVSWLVANASVDRAWFLSEPVAVQRRLVKAVGDRAGIGLEFKHVDEILRFAAEEAASGKELALPQGWKLRRDAHELCFVTPDLRQGGRVEDYEYPLTVPGSAILHAAGTILEARHVPAAEVAQQDPDQLLDLNPEALLTVRNWRAGDRFWPARTKAPRKVKEFLQERHVPQAERKLWPVVLNGDEIVWIRGFAASARFRPQPGQDAILIFERPIAEKLPENSSTT